MRKPLWLTIRGAALALIALILLAGWLESMGPLA